MSDQPVQLEVVEGFEEFSFDQPSGERLLDAPAGPWLDWWGDSMAGNVGSSVDLHPKYSTVPASDFPHIMVFRSEVYEHVWRILSPFGEFLPVNSNVGRLWAFHCTNSVDALDLEHCEGIRWRIAADGSPTNIFSYDHFEFLPEKVREGKVFVVPQRRNSLIYFAQEVAEALMDPPERFTGSTFRRPY